MKTTRKPMSEETKRKISEAKKGKPSGRLGFVMSEEQKLKISASNKGKTLGIPRPALVKRKIGLAWKKRWSLPESEAHRKIVAETMRNRVWSEESREKSRLSHLGRKHTPEERRKQSLAQIGHRPWSKGRIVSEQERQKLSAAQLRREWTLEQRRAHGDKRRGEKSPSWKGGITPENARIRHSLDYKLWRTAVFTRDNWTCVWCGDRSAKGHPVALHADHIREFAKHPEKRMHVDNGRTLCEGCHGVRHGR